MLSAVDALKNKKSRGMDVIPTDLMKYSKDISAEDLGVLP